MYQCHHPMKLQHSRWRENFVSWTHLPKFFVLSITLAMHSICYFSQGSAFEPLEYVAKAARRFTVI